MVVHHISLCFEPVSAAEVYNERFIGTANLARYNLWPPAHTQSRNTGGGEKSVAGYSSSASSDRTKASERRWS